MPSSSFIVFSTIFILLALADANNQYPSYNGGTQGGQQYPSGGYDSYGRFYGSTGTNGRNNGAQDYSVAQRSRSNTRHMALDQRQQPPNPNKKPESATFRDPDFCHERCEFDCQLQMYFTGRDNEPEEVYHCQKLRPPPKAFHEKMIDGFNRAGVFEFIVGGVILFAVLICCICSCYQCCCKGRSFGGPTRRHGAHYNNNDEVENGGAGIGPDGQGKPTGPHSLNGGGTLSTSGLSPEHESLTNNIQHMDETIHAAPLPDKHRFGGINGTLTHHSNGNGGLSHHHHFPRSNTGGGFSSRTQSDV